MNKHPKTNKYLKTGDLPEKTGFCTRYWEKRRALGLPPAFIRIDRNVRYLEEVVDDFMAGRPQRLKRRDPVNPGPGRPRGKVGA